MDREKLPELLEKVKAATGPDERIDCLLWQVAAPDQRVMLDGGKAFGRGPKRPATYGVLSDFPLTGWDDWHAIAMAINAPPVTRSIDAALSLIERMLPGWSLRLNLSEGLRHPSVIMGCSHPVNRSVAIEHHTAPLAIISALLSALIASEAPE